MRGVRRVVFAFTLEATIICFEVAISSLLDSLIDEASEPSSWSCKDQPLRARVSLMVFPSN